jgi:hypothetical protein
MQRRKNFTVSGDVKLSAIYTKHKTGITNITSVFVHMHPCEQERGEKWQKG